MNIWLDSRYSLCEGGNHIKLIKQTQPLAYKEHAYDEIKQGIVSHLIPEGSLLSERVLSEQFAISRTPLREAIQRLELEGWVTSLPRKGIIVKSINLQDVKEVIHEHALILDAIKGKKIKKAQRYAIEHLEHTEAALLEGLKIRDRSSK